MKPILLYPGLRYAHKILNFACKIFFEKCLFAYENRFAVEKKNKKNFGLNFQNNLKNFLCRHQKKVSHTISIYGNCMISIFSKNENLSFLLSPDCFIRIKQPQK